MSTSTETKAPPALVSEDWSRIPWRKLEQTVFRLQKRIYRATERGNLMAVHRLQQLLMRSRAARCIAVRKVTQDHRGKKTAGVDGKKSLNPAERRELVDQIHPSTSQTPQKPPPVRRIWIPKPGKTEKRPLGIPTMKERARQALAKMALEPEWEAKFEANSYGFRPGRGCHDAIAELFICLSQANKWVLDADVKGCFDHISHKALLDKLNTFPAMRRAIKGWLKAGILEGLAFSPSTEGTPQGGVISPLLANVALHGIEDDLQKAYTKKEGTPRLVRYADDVRYVTQNEILLAEKGGSEEETFGSSHLPRGES
jgi:RNA-directed DNA polymerase